VRILHILPHRGGGAERYIDLLERIPGSTHDRVALSGSRRPVGAALSIPPRWVRAAARARRYDLVHVHGDVAAMLSLAQLGPRSVVTTHGLHFLRRARGVKRSLATRGVRAVVSRSARTVCTSAVELEELRTLVGGEVADRLVLVRNAVELPPAPSSEDRRSARSDLGLDDDSVAALYLGALEPRKDPLTAVRAALTVRERGLPFVLLLAGDGPQLAAVRSHAQDGIRALGFRHDTDRLLAAVDLFVMPSAREGLSLAVLEAMSNGVPAVVSDGPGNPEAVGDAGIVVPFGDERAFADALERLARDGAERRRLGAAARERIEREFGVDSFLGGIASVYQQVMSVG
jgi:glycosyltransferase involved in cell wall biosynthesis